MTIREAIDRADRLRPNMHEMKDKMAWLTNVERLVADFMNRHEDVKVELPVYTEASDMDTQLLLQHEDAEIYVTWLMMKYDLHNGDYESYNNMAMAYNDQMKAWEAEYRRMHRPRAKRGGWNLV